LFIIFTINSGKIRGVNSEMGENIVVIGAHPDDYEIGIGMLIAKNVAQGHDVYGIMVSNGEKSGHNGNTSRESEGRKAAEMLGLRDVYFLGYPDAQLHNYYDAIFTDLERLINDLKPAQVFTHCPDDRHLDHRIVREVGESAARKVAEFYGYSSPSIQPNGLSAFDTFFIGSRELMDLKVNVFKEAYASQITKGGIVDCGALCSASHFWAQTFLPYHPEAYLEPLAPLRSRYRVAQNGFQPGWQNE